MIIDRVRSDVWCQWTIFYFVRFLSFYKLFRLLLFENTNVTFIKIITRLVLADSRTKYKLYYTVHKAAFSVGRFEDRISTLSK